MSEIIAVFDIDDRSRAAILNHGGTIQVASTHASLLEVKGLWEKPLPMHVSQGYRKVLLGSTTIASCLLY